MRNFDTSLSLGKQSTGAEGNISSRHARALFAYRISQERAEIRRQETEVAKGRDLAFWRRPGAFASHVCVLRKWTGG
jgi:hypothetical protein